MAVAGARLTGGVVLDRVAAFVDESAVLPAEQDQVGEAGFAAVGPVGTVVGGEVVLVVAAGPAAAALIARFQEAAQPGRHGALAAADAEG